MLCLYNTHQFDAAIKVVIFENSLPLPECRFYRICGVGKDLKYRSTSAPLPPCTCLLQAGLRQTRRLQDLGSIWKFQAHGQKEQHHMHLLTVASEGQLPLLISCLTGYQQ